MTGQSPEGVKRMKRKRGTLFYLILAAAALVTATLVVFLSPGTLPDTPPVILATPPVTVRPAAPTPEDSSGKSVISVTPDTVQTVLRTLSRSDSYSRTLTVERFWSGGVSVSEVNVWVWGDMCRLSIRSEEQDRVRNVLLAGNEKWIWYSDSPNVYTGAAAADEADRWQSIYSYEKIGSLEVSQILDADFLDFGGEKCVYVRFSDGLLGYVSECYVSCSTGLLMGEDVFDGSRVIYTMRSSRPDISTPDTAVFSHP